uniref:Uncharacterized protein n=1 Tax=Arundo donax TaxID=35708 RepID=A0A0A8ZA47_ARUDO
MAASLAAGESRYSGDWIFVCAAAGAPAAASAGISAMKSPGLVWVTMGEAS